MPSRPVSPENIYHIDPEAARDMWHAAYKEASDLPPDFNRTDAGAEAAVEAAYSLAETYFPLGDDLRSAAAELNGRGNNQDVLLVQGLPMPPGAADIEATHDSTMPQKPARAMGLVAVTMTTLFGPPVGYRKGGDAVSSFVTQVAPSRRPNESIVGTNRAGGWHTEFGPSEAKPSVAVLTGVRAGDALTQFISAQAVVSHLEQTDPALLETLREPRFATPSGYVPGEQTRGPLIAETASGSALILGERYRETQDSGDQSARMAVDALVAVLQNPELAVEHCVRPGEAFAFRNLTGLHARSAFTKKKRLLIRTFAGKLGTQKTVAELEDIVKT